MAARTWWAKPALALTGFCAATAIMAMWGLGDRAQAQALINHNSAAPVDFAADSIEVQSRADRVVIAGHVVVQQSGLTLSAQRMTVAYSQAGGVDVNRIDAVGGVTVTKGADNARGNSAVYDLDRRLITLVGNVELNQAGNRLSGQRLVIDLTSGRATVDGRGGAAPVSSGDGATGAPAASSGRVTGRFAVPDRR
ncbi:MAG: LptA/OstA family protein [Sphingopyxis sp.]